MTDNEDPMMMERRRYQWYMGYDRTSEYDKDPQWALDTCSETEESEEEYERDILRIFDCYDPEHIWLKSDTHYDLMNWL